MNDNRRVGWALLGMVGVLLVALLAVELPTRAEPPTPMPHGGERDRRRDAASLRAAEASRSPADTRG